MIQASAITNQKSYKMIFCLCNYGLIGLIQSIRGDKNGLFVRYSNIFYSELNCPYRCIKMGSMGTLSLTQAVKNDKIDNILYGACISLVKYAFVR